MREILFRGKRMDNGEWIEGYYAIQSNHACFAHELKHQHFIFKDIFLDFNLGGLQEFDVIPETVGQYTGLTDKNGKKIFEGDIVGITFHSDAKYQYLIWFNKEMSCWEAIETKDIRFNGNDYYGNNVEYSDFCFMLQDPYGDVESVKIIGNLHDNPELLKEGDENG